MNKFTVEIAWWTGDEWSHHMVKVRAPKPVGARYAAIQKLRRDNNIAEIGDMEFQCRAIYRGHLKNVWNKHA